ncbi:MAG: hypothetical protein K6T39_07595, partial [Anoxybacillus ayderensis]|nr:hypothetical protein [Anoxybacillus ayderensis]
RSHQTQFGMILSFFPFHVQKSNRPSLFSVPHALFGKNPAPSASFTSTCSHQTQFGMILSFFPFHVQKSNSCSFFSV